MNLQGFFRLPVAEVMLSEAMAEKELKQKMQKMWCHVILLKNAGGRWSAQVVRDRDTDQSLYCGDP